MCHREPHGPIWGTHGTWISCVNHGTLLHLAFFFSKVAKYMREEENIHGRLQNLCVIHIIVSMSSEETSHVFDWVIQETK